MEKILLVTFENINHVSTVVAFFNITPFAKGTFVGCCSCHVLPVDGSETSNWYR